MYEQKIRIITEQELTKEPCLTKGQRFALAIREGVDPMACKRAANTRRLPDSADAFLETAHALGFLAWLRFAVDHYGSVICACEGTLAEAVRGIALGDGNSYVGSTSGDTCVGKRAAQLSQVLAPLVGTQYTAIEEFRMLVAELREKCPWDRQQTHVSLLDTLLEEAYEVALAIQRGSMANLKEELGDLLLQIFIQSEIASESHEFDICDVIRTIDGKLTFRHPHVFGDVSAETSDQVLANWQKLKALEGRQKHFVDSAKLLSSIENALLAQETARLDGFDFESIDQAFDKLMEESEELGGEMRATPRNEDAMEMELGDVLFSALNVARLSGINPVRALRHSFDKFRQRYERVCAYAAEQRINMATASAEELDRLWQAAKST